MKSKKLEKFIFSYYGTYPTITQLPSGEFLVTFGYIEYPAIFRYFKIYVFPSGTWNAWTRCNNESWRSVESEYEFWYLFIKPLDTAGIQLTYKLCSLMGANFEDYKEPLG